MKNRILKIVIALFLSFSLIDGVCFALKVGPENAQIEFYGDDEGVYTIITDPQGRRVGYDITTKKYIEEFPASFGFSFKDIDEVGNEVGGRDEISDKFNGGGMLNLIPGTYTIEVIGVSLTTYDLDIAISRRITSEGFTSFSFNGIIDKDLTSKFEMTYNSDPSKPAGSVVRVASLSSLKQDIALSRKIGWIDNDGIMMSLYKKAEAIEKSLARDDKNTAKNQLDALINEVNAQKGKHIKDEAIKILLEDAQYLMEHL